MPSFAAVIGAKARGKARGAAAAAAPDAATLDAACFGLYRTSPHLSARHSFERGQVLCLLALAAAFLTAAVAAPNAILAVVRLLAFLLFAAVICWRLLAAVRRAPIPLALASPARYPIYTLLCPLYREANVVHDLVAALGRLDYPKRALDVKLLVEGDDLATVSAALSAAHAAHIEVVIVPPAEPRTKPKALNVGLARARGAFVAVYDAEDRPHPLQLRAALAAFETGDATLACVQAPLEVDNAGASWIAGQFAVEYAIQFTQILPLLARLGLPLPLGGTSNHFRAEALREVGGWDPFNVTEDADLGYRLARFGLRSQMIAPPTWEEAPVSFRAWLDQRTRWLKGHMQSWLVLMRNPARSLAEMGWPAFLSLHLVLGMGLLVSLAHGPIFCALLLALLTPYDLGAADFALACVGYAVALFAVLLATPRRLPAALTMPLYWPLASLAAVRALRELIVRPHHWSKTAHGISRRPDVARRAQPRPASNFAIASTSSSRWSQDTTRRASPELSPPQS